MWYYHELKATENTAHELESWVGLGNKFRSVVGLVSCSKTGETTVVCRVGEH